MTTVRVDPKVIELVVNNLRARKATVLLPPGNGFAPIETVALRFDEDTQTLRLQQESVGLQITTRPTTERSN